MALSTTSSKRSKGEFIISMCSQPPTKVLSWWLAYRAKWGLPVTEHPPANQWCLLWDGDDIVAASGETFDLRHNTIKLTDFLAEPTRRGVRALDEMLNMYVELVVHGSLACVGGDALAGNKSIQRRCRKAGFEHYSSTFLVGRPD